MPFTEKKKFDPNYFSLLTWKLSSIYLFHIVIYNKKKIPQRTQKKRHATVQYLELDNNPRQQAK